MTINTIKIPEFMSLSTLPSRVIVMFGEKKALEYRSFFRRALKLKLAHLYQLPSLDYLWHFETADTIKSPADFLGRCSERSLFDPIRFFYFEDVSKITGLKKMKFTKELKDLDLVNFIILDHFGSKPSKDLSTISNMGNPPLFVDCSLDYLFTAGHKNMVTTVVQWISGKNVSKGLQEYLVRRYELNLSELIQDLFYMRVSLDNFNEIQLTPQLFEDTLINQHPIDVKYFINSVASANVYKVLETLNHLYSEEDPSYYLMVSLNNFLEQMLFILRNQNMNSFDISRHLFIRSSDVDYYRKNLQHWDESRIRKAFIEIANFEEAYILSQYSKEIGHSLMDQMLISILAQ